MQHVQQQVEELKRILVYVAAALLILSAVGGWLLAGRALAPVDEITRRAQLITEHDLRQRLNIRQDDELGRMAATFDALIGRLEEAFERQKRFTTDASHELRTPLTIMRSELSVALARPRPAEEYRQTLLSMEEEAERLSIIVKDLMLLTRLDGDRAGMQQQPVPLHDLVGELSRQVQMIAAEQGSTVVVGSLDPAIVTGDATRLRQLFTNLLHNAVTYTPAGGRITVRLTRAGTTARVQISDTGIGIAPADLPHVFDRFYRSAEARAHHGQGTGLGLAIARSVAQAHHGEITIESVPEHGTTVTVVLPCAGRARRTRVALQRKRAGPVISA